MNEGPPPKINRSALLLTFLQEALLLTPQKEPKELLFDFVGGEESLVELAQTLASHIDSLFRLRKSSSKNQETSAPPPSIHLALQGEVSAGKTTLVRTLAEKLTLKSWDQVESPTFTYIHEHALLSPPSTLLHYDLHRIPQGPHALEGLDLAHHLEREGVHCIEWADRFPQAIAPFHPLWIEIIHHEKQQEQRIYRLTTRAPSHLQAHEEKKLFAQQWKEALHQLQFLGSFDQLHDLRAHQHHALPEIVVVGRSNVGKSTLLNSLTQKKQLARVSKTPGKTRQFVLFALKELAYLVDLPGYGFARVSHKERDRWDREFRAFFATAPALTLLLIDSRHGLKKSDLELLEFLAQSWKTHPPDQAVLRRLLLVFTKWDKIPATKKRPRKKELLAQLKKVEASLHLEIDYAFIHHASPELRDELVEKISTFLVENAP